MVRYGLAKVLRGVKAPQARKKSANGFRNLFLQGLAQHENGDLRNLKVCVNLRKVGHPTLRKLSTARKGL